MIVLLIISLLIIALLMFLLYKVSRRVLQYDKVLRIIAEDIEINVDYLTEMLSQHVSTNAPEIIELDKNLKLMRDRFIEVITAIAPKKEEESTDE